MIVTCLTCGNEIGCSGFVDYISFADIPPIDSDEFFNSDFTIKEIRMPVRLIISKTPCGDDKRFYVIAKCGYCESRKSKAGLFREIILSAMRTTLLKIGWTWVEEDLKI